MLVEIICTLCTAEFAVFDRRPPTCGQAGLRPHRPRPFQARAPPPPSATLAQGTIAAAAAAAVVFPWEKQYKRRQHSKRRGVSSVQFSSVDLTSYRVCYRNHNKKQDLSIHSKGAHKKRDQEKEGSSQFTLQLVSCMLMFSTSTGTTSFNTFLRKFRKKKKATRQQGKFS